MSSILNMLNFGGDNDLNLIIIVPVFAVVVAVAFLLKFSLRKPEVTKKTQNVKKAQKVQTTNNQKEEKIVDKKEKVVKEKKPSSLTKSQDKQTANEAAKPKTTKKQQKQEAAVNEKPSKKTSAQNKKQQINNSNTNNISAKNNQKVYKKQVDIFINKAEEGEWQMVTTKKQKQNKQEENVEIAKTPVKTTKKSAEKANIQSTNKTKKAKEVTEKSNNSSKVVNGGLTTVEEIKALGSEPKEFITKSSENSTVPSEITKVTNKNENFDSGLSRTNAVPATNVEVKTSAHEAAPVANVAFDELGDDGWTDTKTQKKNRRKALRE